MIINQLYSQILHGKWLIDPIYGMAQGPIVANLINQLVEVEPGEPDPLSAFAVSAKAVTGVRYSYYDGFDRAPSGSVAVIRLNGPLMKNDQYCGPSGMATIGNIIKEADAHDNIDAIILHVDSPGGTVDGTEALANIVKNTQKPVLTYVDGLMASAALWIGSAADEIMASTDTDEIGSCGVRFSLVDVQPYWEKLGIKFHDIVATTSPDKVKVWEDIRKGKYESFQKEHLDPLDAKFMQTVKENCPGASDEHLTGKVYFARDVMGVFVDSIGTLEEAITRASEMASEKRQQSIIPNTPSSMKQFANVNAALGVDALESVDETVSLNEEQLGAMDAALGANATVAADLEAEQTAHATTRTELETAQETIRTQTAELEGLRKKPAGSAPVAPTSKDKGGEANEPGPVSKGEDIAADMDAVAKEYFNKGDE